MTASPSRRRRGRLCDLLGADPLGLIASGSLLVCCDPAEAAGLLAALAAAGIPATDIGELTAAGGGGRRAAARAAGARPALRDRRGRAAAGGASD